LNRLSALFPLLKSYRWNLFTNALLNILGAVLSIFSFLSVVPFLRILFGGAVERTPTDDIPGKIGAWFDSYVLEVGAAHALVMICAFVVILAILKNTTTYLAMYSLATIRTGVSRDLRNSTYSRVLSRNMGWFTSARKGDVLSRLTVDLKEVEDSIVGSIVVMFKAPLLIIISFGALLVLSWELTLFAILFLPISGILISRIAKKLKKSALKGTQELGSLVNILEETLSGMRIIKSFGASSMFMKRFEVRNEEHFFAMRKMYRREYMSSPVSEVISLSVMAVLLGYGGNIVLSGGSGLTGDWFIGYLVVFSQVIPPARALSDGWFKISKGVASLERVEEMFDSLDDIEDLSISSDSTPTVKESIEFKDVSFAYGETQVLDSINLSIKKGEVVALVGPSGSGKTTLSNLLIRFDSPASGIISVDGSDLNDIPLTNWRQQLGVVTQESILFHGTIASNIALCEDVPDKIKLRHASEAAQVTEFADKLPDGLNSNVGDGGGKLSGGQRQRVALARALYRDPAILVLDEATSALDAASEHAVQQALDAAMKDRTVLVIAHRLSTVRRADKIVLIEKGKVVEQGSHEVLMQNNGPYAKLVNLQSFSS